MSKLRYALKNLDEIFLSITLGGIFLVLVLQVFFRYCMNSPLIWSEELARYLFVWMTMIGLGYNVRHNNNISMTLLYVKFPPLVRLIISCLSNLVGICAYGWVLPQAIRYTMAQSSSQSAAMQVSMGFLAVAVPLGLCLLIIQFALDIVRQIRRYKEGGAC